jgi:hypothetical protein
MYDLRSPLQRALNRKPAKPHLYSRNLRSLHTKRSSIPVLKADEAMHLDEIIEKLEPALSSSEIFAAFRTGAGWQGEAASGGKFREKRLAEKVRLVARSCPFVLASDS